MINFHLFPNNVLLVVDLQIYHQNKLRNASENVVSEEFSFGSEK